MTDVCYTGYGRAYKASIPARHGSRPTRSGRPLRLDWPQRRDNPSSMLGRNDTTWLVNHNTFLADAWIYSETSEADGSSGWYRSGLPATQTVPSPPHQRR